MKKLLLHLNRIKTIEADGWGRARKHACCPGDDWADGYNQAIKDLIKLIKTINR